MREWLLAALFLVAGTMLFSRDSHFPSFYHPDEPSKARQVIDGDYNFNHPMLLLQVTRVIAWASQAAMTPQPITEAGRFASALFSAAAIACLVLLACHLRGWTAGVFTGLFLMVNQHLYELSHYMKEDPAVTFGMAAAFLAFVRCQALPSAARFAIFGATCALAVSGKYIGVVVLPLAVIALATSPKGGRLILSGTFLASFLAMFSLVNFPLLTSLGVFATNVERETDYALHGHKGLTRSVPHGVYGKVFREATNPAIWICLGLYYAALLQDHILAAIRAISRWFRKSARWTERITPRSTSLAEWIIALFPIAYVLLLSFSPKTHHRYFLPDTALFCALAAIGLASVHLPHYVRLGMAAVVAAVSVVYWTPTANAFRNDARAALVTYVRANIPKDATIVQDKRVNLPNRNDPRQSDSPYFLKQPLRGKLFAADEGTIGELRAAGIHYIAVSEGDYGRYYLDTHKPRAEEKADYDRRKAFYTQLFADGKLLWECKGGDNIYLQPAIKLYYLP